jgi:hypothetical protein
MAIIMFTSSTYEKARILLALLILWYLTGCGYISNNHRTNAENKNGPPSKKDQQMASEDIKVEDAVLGLRSFLYADMSLKEQAARLKGSHHVIDNALSLIESGKAKQAEMVLQSVSKSEPIYRNPTYWTVLAYVKQQSGNLEGSRESIRRIFMLPNIESGSLLSACNALRELGDESHVVKANEVVGVITEIAYKDTAIIMAGYEDGSSQLLFGTGGGVLGGKEHFPKESIVAAKRLVHSTQSFVGKAPLEEQRQLPKRDHVRFALLTCGGIHVLEERIGVLEQKNTQLDPVWSAANQLLGVLLSFMREQNKR